jgi:hypothetical protein
LREGIDRMNLARLLTLTMCATAAATALAVPDRVLFDFESGTFAGWTVEGEAFGKAPVAAEEVQAWREDRRPQATWRDRKVVLTRTRTDAWPEHSFLHSPTVVRRGDWWYLLAGPVGNSNASRFHYRQLFRSKSPFDFGTVEEHGPHKGLFLEGGHSVVRDAGGKWHVTHDGVYAGGVWVAPLRWNDGQVDPAVTLPPGAAAGAAAKRVP